MSSMSTDRFWVEKGFPDDFRYMRYELEDENACGIVLGPRNCEILRKAFILAAGTRVVESEDLPGLKFWRHMASNINDVREINERVQVFKHNKRRNDCGVCKVKIAKGDECAYGFSKMERSNGSVNLVLCEKHPYHLYCAAALQGFMQDPLANGPCLGLAYDRNASGKKGGKTGTVCGC